MILFIGDLASPNEETSKKLDLSLTICKDKLKFDGVICNFEGLLSNNTSHLKSNSPVLYNHVSILNTLVKNDFIAVSLANNHTLDIPGNFNYTKDKLSNNSVGFFGATDDNNSPLKFKRFEHNSVHYSMLGFCWKVLNQHNLNVKSINIADFNPEIILKNIKEEKLSFPDNKIFIMPHWNVDLELLPFPMYRKFAKACIDEGANGVIGNHSHCIQGGEMYNSGFIVYGLGNFYIPWGYYANSTLIYPEFTKKSLGLLWDEKTNFLQCVYFMYDNQNDEIKLIETEPFDSGKIINSYSKYRGLSDSQYINFFKENRRKKLVPIYRSFKNKYEIYLYDLIMTYKIKFTRTLSKLKLRKWRR